MDQASVELLTLNGNNLVMKYIRSWGSINEQKTVLTAEHLVLTAEQESWLDECVESGGTWSMNPWQGLVDVFGNFDCVGKELEDFKGVRFGRVTGSFFCNKNKLTSLEGSPRDVAAWFVCSSNELRSLEGGPQSVGGNYWCSNNKLENLNHAPKNIYGSFSCEENLLTTLEGAPEFVRGSMECGGNRLISLKGGPERIGGPFHCSRNQLTSVEGFPKYLGSTFYCYENPVSAGTLKMIAEQIGYYPNKSYSQIIEGIWEFIPKEEKPLIYQPDFDWLSQQDHKILASVKKFNTIKGMV